MILEDTYWSITYFTGFVLIERICADCLSLSFSASFFVYPPVCVSFDIDIAGRNLIQYLFTDMTR